MISFLRECEEVENLLSDLVVFEQYFKPRNKESIDINITPILEELCYNENIFQKKFISKYSDPMKNLKDLGNVDFCTLIKCDRPSSVNFFISYNQFEFLFMKSIEDMTLNNLHLLFTTSIRQFISSITYSNGELIKILYKLNESFLNYRLTRAKFVNKFVSLLIKVQDKSVIKSRFSDLVSFLALNLENEDSEVSRVLTSLNEAINEESISFDSLFSSKTIQRFGIDHLSIMNNIIKSFQNNIKTGEIDKMTKMFADKHNELMSLHLTISLPTVARLHQSSHSFIEILVKASRVMGELYNSSEFFNSIEKFYKDINESCNELTEIIMKIVASCPNIKVIFLLSKDCMLYEKLCGNRSKDHVQWY